MVIDARDDYGALSDQNVVDAVAVVLDVADDTGDNEVVADALAVDVDEGQVQADVGPAVAAVADEEESVELRLVTEEALLL